MEKEKRVTIRLSEPLHRVLTEEATQQGLNLSEHMRRLLLASRPHLAVLEDVGNILAAGKAVEKGEDYLPYLLNTVKRLEKGLEALRGFDERAAQWRQQAEAELTACLTHVRERAQQFTSVGELVRFFQKSQGGEDLP